MSSLVGGPPPPHAPTARSHAGSLPRECATTRHQPPGDERPAADAGHARRPVRTAPAAATVHAPDRGGPAVCQLPLQRLAPVRHHSPRSDRSLTMAPANSPPATHSVAATRLRAGGNANAVHRAAGAARSITVPTSGLPLFVARPAARPD